MLDPEYIRKNPDAVRQMLVDRAMDPTLLDVFLKVDETWRAHVATGDGLRARLNALSRERKIEAARMVKQELTAHEGKGNGLEQERHEALAALPNMHAPDVPIGASDKENVVLRTWPQDSVPERRGKTFYGLGADLGIIDTERASKVAGTRFGYLVGGAALLEFALVRFAMDTLTREGFIPVIPPVMVKPDILIGMGKRKFMKDDDLFFIEKDKLYLAGSSEHTIGPMHKDETFDAADLPRRYVGSSTCFRRESGSYGKDTRGILRVHQFNKVEMFSFTTPDASEAEHQFLLSLEEQFMQQLELPYRVVAICTGDMGFGDYRQYDIEAWFPGSGEYRETHSCSNTGDYQARGLQMKYRDAGGTHHLHTLNATVFSQRPILAILENYQQRDGSVQVPKALQGYVGLREIVR
ncbi:serine--tRNA ligase [Candidatus Uhrbacteria bacterium]|nr:serine--tRNA ligase [Candidatus Uhrbacteria bacterium]